MVVSPDDVAQMAKEEAKKAVEACANNSNNQARNTVGALLDTAWIDPQKDGLDMSSSAKRGGAHQRRSSDPLTSMLRLKSLDISPNSSAQISTVDNTNANTGGGSGNICNNEAQRKEAAALKKKLSVNVVDKAKAGKRHSVAVVTSPKWATARELELIAAANEHEHEHEHGQGVGATAEDAGKSNTNNARAAVSSSAQASKRRSSTRRRRRGSSKGGGSVATSSVSELSKTRRRPPAPPPPSGGANGNNLDQSSSVDQPTPLRSSSNNNSSYQFEKMARRSSQISAVSSLSSMDSLPDLHEDLATASWSALHSNLAHLATNSELILPALTATDSDYCTPLHVAVWKAPPSLAILLISLLRNASAELSSGLLLSRDSTGNTALHFCAGNGTGDSYSVMDALIKAAPRALTFQNAEGDTPLHLAASNPTSSVDCISLLLEAYPEATLLQDCSGATPLHAAIANKASGAVIQKLLSVAPKMASVVDNDGLLPLHYVGAFLHTDIDSVKKIITIYPSAVIDQSKEGDVPLHTAVVNSNDEIDEDGLRILELLVTDSNGVEPILMTNKEHSNPLHCCAIFNSPARLIKFLMTFPSSRRAVCMINNTGATPLHLAAAHSSVAQSVSTIVALGTPEGAAVEDRIKGTALHVATQNMNATGNLIDALLSLNPEATSIPTQRGHLPLHLAAQSPCACSESVVKKLLAHDPESAQVRNKSSNTPLHDAAKYRASVQVVTLILDVYPDALYIQNQYGNLPLHCATAYQASSNVVQLLLKRWPEGASVQNCNQDAPLHYAASNDSSLEIIQAIVKAAPASVLLLNSIGQSPVERAQANNAPSDVVEFLEEATEEWGKKAATESWGVFDDIIPNDTAAEF